MKIMKRKLSKLHIFTIITVLTAAVSLTLLINRTNHANAGLLDNFKPGNIMSDYVMGNRTTMTEAEIQAFLKSKNHCNDTNITKAKQYPHLQYSIKDGHFVCMADEDFNGETAAHIIWQAAQDYKINPQVLIVLLQKEQGLVTDTWPNHIQYRSATGYGCPDTAPCDSQYYGLKNQIRMAARLFRTVLDGGWTNYPLGENYVLYNPNRTCGGSVINIENRATSALYRYTPYQPNAGALAAGYGTAHCGAYGNRNFYLYFTNWFGDPSVVAKYSSMSVPRYMTIKNDLKKINLNTGLETGEIVPSGTDIKFTTKTTQNNKLYLRSEQDTESNNNHVVSFEDLAEILFVDLNKPQYLELKTDSYKLLSSTLTNSKTKVAEATVIEFTDKIIVNKQVYYRATSDKTSNQNLVLPLTKLQEASFKPFIAPRYMQLKEDSRKENPLTGEVSGSIFKKGTQFMFNSKLNLDGLQYFREDNDSLSDIFFGFKATSLEEISFEEVHPQIWFIPKKDSPKYLVPNGQATSSGGDGITALPFKQKVTMGSASYYQSEEDQNKNNNLVFSIDDLESISFSKMDVPRNMMIKSGTYAQNLDHMVSSGNQIVSNTVEYFNQKAVVNNVLFLRTSTNSEHELPVAINYENLSEIPKASVMQEPRFLIIDTNTHKVNYYTREQANPLSKNTIIFFTQLIKLDNQLYLISIDDANADNKLAIRYSDLGELPQFEPMIHPRALRLKTSTFKINVFNNAQDNDYLEKNQIILFDTKITINDRLFLRSRLDSLANSPLALPYDQLAESL